MVTLTLLHPQASTPLAKWHFKSQSKILIGRSPDNDVVLNDPLVSRYHLELRAVTAKSSHRWQIINQGSNGTFLNGVLISREWLPENALIRLAREGPLLKFQINQVTRPSLPIPPAPEASICHHQGNPPGNLFCIHCGQPLLVQRVIRHYQVLRILGQGGMGTTYLAWDNTGKIDGKPSLLVLKEMNSDMIQIAKAQELFEREARTLKALNHSGIPRYYDFFVEEGKKYLAMELIHGEDLEKRVVVGSPVAPREAIEWMIQTCSVLDYIHSCDPPLIHRDIKPANLLLRHRDNRIFVLDFGAVKEIGTLPGTRIGAEGYSAPEQERGMPVTQSDLYAIGPTLIFLITGKPPLKFWHKRGSLYRFDLSGVPGLDSRLRQTIERICDINLADRYQTAREVSHALAACL
ncbi:MAG TPA: serine/threonine protein kinase [Cyanobacteria bacterium UBA11149]|nr:serine/threonine protein kinase [Cyanobacteria bacterium UBA11367]HBR72672.1 serine/threonine protein kinase [Cyanobacteria bacterium UBA11159]HBS71562.1 serine/threonine protein kinase [Cyanobacteria bacterium UBA11153]HBW90730.1 serine/threonine protein kinase [Cyanobacteria bacterium UBA11149]HCA97475.1 serine/threonine protein kinase [Cyanobacteria bacterium UBA9226]